MMSEMFLCLFDGAKVRRFLLTHNTTSVAFAYHKFGILLKKCKNHPIFLFFIYLCTIEYLSVWLIPFPND